MSHPNPADLYSVLAVNNGRPKDINVVTHVRKDLETHFPFMNEMVWEMCSYYGSPLA